MVLMESSLMIRIWIRITIMIEEHWSTRATLLASSTLLRKINTSANIIRILEGLNRKFNPCAILKNNLENIKEKMR
jgi:hypothetical protein